jgi:serine protease inhibitor ecotin
MQGWGEDNEAMEKGQSPFITSFVCPDKKARRFPVTDSEPMRVKFIEHSRKISIP